MTKTLVKVAIANDTIMALEALRRAIATAPAYRLIWTAKDGIEAVEKAKQHQPDLILMDLLMPKMSGVDATREIMANSPCAILIVTGSVRRNTSRVFEAMGCGALDVVQTPTLIRSQIGQSAESDWQTAAQPLLAKMATVSKFLGKYDRRADHKPNRYLPTPKAPQARSLIVIGASTGGPKALANVLSQLPPSMPAAVIVAQHIDPQFVEGLAEWLARQSALPVRLAQHGDVPIPGEVLLAGAQGNEGGHSGGQLGGQLGGQSGGHLAMRRDQSLTYLAADSPAVADTAYRPSIDVLFKSIAQHWRSPGQAALLTGMGRDGAAGLAQLRTRGWHTIAESQESCVVYGMPRAAAEMNAASEILNIDAIAPALLSHIETNHPMHLV